MIQRLLETFAFFRTYLADISKFLAVSTLPIILLQTYISHFEFTPETSPALLLLPGLVGFIYQPVYTAGMIYLIARKVSGEPWRIRDSLAVGFSIWPTLLLVNFIAMFLTIVGLLFFILPGLFIFARLSLAQFRVVLEGARPKDALVGSNALSKPFTFSIIGCSVFITLALLILDVLLQQLTISTGMDNFITRVVSGLIFLILSSNLTILLYRFWDLAHKGPRAPDG